MIRGIHHISMKCGTQEEYAAAKAFYCGLLGLRVLREWPEGVMIDTGAGRIEIFCNGEGIRTKGAIRHVALAVDNVDALAERIRSAGYEVFIEPKDIVTPSDPPVEARMAFCRGPLGEEIELFRERPPRAEGDVREITAPEEKTAIAREVLEALTDWFAVTESREMYIRDSAEQPFFAVYAEGRPAGFLCLKETGEATVELAVMGVRRDFHRQGLGRALFRAARAWAVAQGYAFMQVKTVRMGCYEDYDRTNLFYKSLGFRELEVFPTLWDEANPCQIYVMALAPERSLLDVILRRRSYRGKFRPDPVPRAHLKAIMEAGLAAPSGCNKQTTSLLAVDDPEVLQALRAVIDPPVGETAPAVICVLTRRINAYRDRCFATQDYAAAIENMLLAITALGYQSCWYEGHITDTDRIGDRMARILGVPETYELVCFLPVGIAEGAPSEPKKKPFETRAWLNGFPEGME